LEVTFLEPILDEKTALLAAGHEAVCIFVNDDANAKALEILKQQGVKFIALRCAGYNNASNCINLIIYTDGVLAQVDLKKASELGLLVARVPAYSPDAVAEVKMIFITLYLCT
jgi:D-lactate dehydrogenase